MQPVVSTDIVSASRTDFPTMVREVEADGFIRVNDAFSRLVGYSAEELSCVSLLEWIEPSDRTVLERIFQAGGGSARARHRTAAGESIACCWKVQAEGDSLAVFGYPCDSFPATSSSDKVLAVDPGHSDMRAVLREMALIIEDERPGLKCSILLLDDEARCVRVGAGPSLPAEYNEAVEGLEIGPFVGSCGTAAFWNERVIVEDIQNDPLWRDLKVYAASAGVAACWSQPVVSSSGKVLGAMALYSPVPRAPTQSELDGLRTGARLFAVAIAQGRAEEALRVSEAERINREAEFERQLQQAAKMEALGVLAGGIAHDFNNLLTTIRGNAEIAEYSVPLAGEAHHMIQNINSACERAGELCSQLLAYAGRKAISKEAVDLNVAIRELGELLKVTMSKKATLEFQLHEEPTFVEADKAQLNQVILNLISNAAEALEDKAGRITAATGVRDFETEELASFVAATADGRGTYAWLSVSDTGCGLDPETQAKIFDPFFTTKSSGRGLGLAAVSGIILKHRGAVRIESEPGEGTTFTVLLPVANAPERPDVPEALPASGESDELSVLVVDDEESVRNVLVKGLRIAGFRTRAAKDGREAVELFKAHAARIDCVLLDMNMPGLDGVETFEELRRINPEVRVVLCSGCAEQDIHDRFGDAQPPAFISKPCLSRDVAAKLREVVAAASSS